MNDIKQNINGVNYILLERLIVERTEDDYSSLILELGCIEQGIKHIKVGGLFSSTYMVILILVPETKVMEFIEKERKFN